MQSWFVGHGRVVFRQQSQHLYRVPWWQQYQQAVPVGHPCQPAAQCGSQFCSPARQQPDSVFSHPPSPL
jgi:hypothetical protein